MYVCTSEPNEVIISCCNSKRDIYNVGYIVLYKMLISNTYYEKTKQAMYEKSISRSFKMCEDLF